MRIDELGDACDVDLDEHGTRSALDYVVSAETVSEGKGLSRKTTVIVTVQHGDHFPIIH